MHQGGCARPRRGVKKKMSHTHASEGGREKGKERAPLAQDASTAHCRTIACASTRAQPLDHALTCQCQRPAHYPKHHNCFL